MLSTSGANVLLAVFCMCAAAIGVTTGAIVRLLGHRSAGGRATVIDGVVGVAAALALAVALAFSDAANHTSYTATGLCFAMAGLAGLVRNLRSPRRTHP